MKHLIYALMTALIALSAPGKDGTGTSNGGDQVRASYIKGGKVVIEALKTTTVGQKTAKSFNLDLSALDATLDINKIKVVKGPLTDATGSIVDAIGVPGKVKLDEEKWTAFFSSGKDIYYLIFHEMLRSASYNDDNYRISSAMNPLPAANGGIALKSGVYHSFSTGNPTACSLRVDHDPTRGFLTLQFVDQYNGGYACNKSILQRFSCGGSEFDLEPNTCGLNCYHSGAGTDVCQAIIEINSSTSFSLTSSSYRDPELGRYEFAAAQGLPPTKFLGLAAKGWTFSLSVAGTCQIPPYNASIDCNLIPTEVVQQLCDGQTQAEQMALVRCQNVLNKECKILSSTTGIYIKRPVQGYVSDRVETGCESKSTAIAK